MAEASQDKRRYFRVDDTINLTYKLVDESRLQTGSHVSTDVLGSCSLASAMDVLNKEALALVPRLERRDPELFEYLRIIDNKINLLAQALNPRGEEFGEQDMREVNLSASGVAFGNRKAIAEGSLLELRMLLTSSLVVIVAIAKVVQCKDVSADNPEQPYWICTEYLNMAEEDRELLIKHAIKKQMQQLRGKHGS